MRARHRVPRRAGTVAVLLAGLLAAAPAAADTDAVAVADAGARAPAAWRGSRLTYRNVATALSLDKGADLTWNPTYVMSLQASPRWWFGKIFWVGVDAGLSGELTNADDTTKRGEVLWDDTLVRTGASSFYRIPVAGIELSAGLDLITPTSKLSQARTLQAGLRPSLGLSRTFPVLEGLSLSYTLQGTRFFNEFTTSRRNAPLVPGCSGGDCDPFLNSGLRNPAWRVTNLGGLSLDFTPWLGFSASVGLVLDFLYPQEDVDPRVSYASQPGQDRRYTMVYEFELSTRPMPSLGLALGTSTVNPQLRPDSGYEAPFINRYTTVYLDLTLHVDGLVSQILSTKE